CLGRGQCLRRPQQQPRLHAQRRAPYPRLRDAAQRRARPRCAGDGPQYAWRRPGPDAGPGRLLPGYRDRFRARGPAAGWGDGRAEGL
ncbi:hypothetical protein LTR04_003029, partial [Oleoguttula sp. CCFEE 6159]